MQRQIMKGRSFTRTAPCGQAYYRQTLLVRRSLPEQLAGVSGALHVCGRDAAGNVTPRRRRRYARRLLRLGRRWWEIASGQREGGETEQNNLTH